MVIALLRETEGVSAEYDNMPGLAGSNAYGKSASRKLTLLFFA